jgi:hypothetical protein
MKATKLRQARNRPPEAEPFIWFAGELRESDAWRSVLLAARRVSTGTHGPQRNREPTAVTHTDFEKFGIRPKSNLFYGAEHLCLQAKRKIPGGLPAHRGIHRED